MNIRQIREILVRNSNVKRTGNYSKDNEGLDYEYTNLKALRNSIKELSILPFFLEQIEALKETSAVDDYRDAIMVDYKNHSIISSKSSELQAQITGLIRFIDEFTKTEEEDTIHVKLPELNTIDDLTDILKDLKRAVEIPSLEVGGQAKIVSFERGSIWIQIFVGATIAVRLIGKLVKIATDANIELKKGQVFGQYINNLKLKNEVLEMIKKAQEEQLKSLIQQGASEIDDSEFDDTNNERVERLKLAIRSMSDLLNKGAEFLPSSKSSDEIKNIFPDTSEEIKMIEENVKSLMKIGTSQNEEAKDD